MSMPNETVPAANFEARCQRVLQFARDLYRQSPDWIRFFKEVVGVDGAARKVFTNQQEYIAFERSETFHTIQRMVNALRNNKATSSSSHEPTRVITVRLPESLHEALKAEANDHSTSMNKLCIAKLLQVLEEDEVSRKKQTAQANYNQQQAAYRQGTYQTGNPNQAAYNNQVRQAQARQQAAYNQQAQNRGQAGQMAPQPNPIQRQNLNNPVPAAPTNPAAQAQNFRANNPTLNNPQVQRQTAPAGYQTGQQVPTQNQPQAGYQSPQNPAPGQPAQQPQQAQPTQQPGTPPYRPNQF